MTSLADATTTRSRNPFAVRDFRLLWIGEAVSSIGDQFALIALPWLALVLTGSALALGSVLALMAVPRALLMLIGGVSVDRLSPRRGRAVGWRAALDALRLRPGVRGRGCVLLPRADIDGPGARRGRRAPACE